MSSGPAAERAAPAYRGADLAKTLEEARGGLPGLREVISLADWDAFIRSGSTTQRLPEVVPDELTAYCRAHLAAHKTPRHWVFTDAFPLTGSGKIQKFLLREQFS